MPKNAELMPSKMKRMKTIGKKLKSFVLQPNGCLSNCQCCQLFWKHSPRITIYECLILRFSLQFNFFSAQLADRNHANRVSQFSNDSKYSNSSSNGSSTIIIQHNKDKWTTSVEIERNDSGLGSETGKSGKRPVKIRGKLGSNKTSEQQICEDCDQVIEESTATKR